ncbi:MAG: hypothetical protein ACREE4_10905 [Stellaceae bacterium]
MKANIGARHSIAQIYPPEAFAVDSAQNQKQPANPIAQGVRIVSAPDRSGAFEPARARQNVGETGESAGAIILAPFRPLAGDAIANDPRAGYEAFLDEIVRAARQFGYRRELSPGPGDARLRGLRQ